MSPDARAAELLAADLERVCCGQKPEVVVAAVATAFGRLLVSFFACDFTKGFAAMTCFRTIAFTEATRQLEARPAAAVKLHS